MQPGPDSPARHSGTQTAARLLARAPQPWLVVNERAEVQQAGPALFALLRGTADDVVGRCYLDLVDPADHDAMKRAVAQGTSVRSRWRTSDGSTRTIEWELTATSPIGSFFAWGQDVTDLLLDLEFSAKKERRRRDLLALAAHELRNSLASIVNAQRVIELSAEGVDRLQRVAGIIERQTSHLGRLVENLVQMSDSSVAKAHLELAMVDLCEVVDETLDRRRRRQARPLVDWQNASDSVFVKADLVRTIELLDQVLDEAFDDQAEELQLATYGSESWGTIEVRTTRAVAGTWRGVGRTAGAETEAETFVPVHESSVRASANSALWDCLMLANLQGGSVETLVGEDGALLGLRLKLPVRPERLEPRSSNLPRRQLRLLIVEDHVDAGQSLRDALESLGHHVMVATTGETALGILQSHGADVMLCDLGLPGINGYELAKAVRASAAFAQTTLIAFTAYQQLPQDKQDAPFDFYLSKPVQAATLEPVLEGISGP